MTRRALFQYKNASQPPGQNPAVMQSSPPDHDSVRLLTEMVLADSPPPPHTHTHLPPLASTQPLSSAQGFGVSDAESALVRGGGIEAAVALLLRDHPQHAELSARGGRGGGSGSGAPLASATAPPSPAVLSSSVQFCVRVSDIESGEQVRR
jgi:hypothetical protein